MHVYVYVCRGGGVWLGRPWYKLLSSLFRDSKDALVLSQYCYGYTKKLSGGKTEIFCYFLFFLSLRWINFVVKEK